MLTIDTCLAQRPPWFLIWRCIGTQKYILWRLMFVKQCLRNLFYFHEKSSKKLRELSLLDKTFKNIYELKPLKSPSTRWISHVVQSMNGFVNKCGVYIQNVTVNTLNHCDKAMFRREKEAVLIVCRFMFSWINSNTPIKYRWSFSYVNTYFTFTLRQHLVTLFIKSIKY